MTLIDEIRKKIAADEFEYSKHAVDQSIVRRISVQEIRQVISRGEVIEDYPEDKYGPSCLIFGWTVAARPLHVQCTDPYQSALVKIITVYEPDEDRWIDFRERRR